MTFNDQLSITHMLTTIFLLLPFLFIIDVSQNEVLGIDGTKGLVKSENGRGKTSPEDTSLSSNVGDSPNRVTSKPPRKQAKPPGSGGHVSSSSMFLEANAVGVLEEYPDSSDGLGHGKRVACCQCSYRCTTLLVHPLSAPYRSNYQYTLLTIRLTNNYLPTLFSRQTNC